MTLISRSILLAFLTLPSSSFAADNEALMHRIITLWEARQEATDNLKYVIAHKKTYPKGIFNAILGTAKPGSVYPESDTTYSHPMKLWLDLERNRARFEYSGDMFNSDLLRSVSVKRIHLCDGNTMQEYRPREHNEALAGDPYAPEVQERIPDGRFRGMFFDAAVFPIFLAHGVLPNSRQSIVVPTALRTPLEPDFYYLYDKIIAEDRTLAVVRTRPVRASDGLFFEAWVNIDRNGAIEKWIAYRRNQVSRDYEISYQRTEHGWLPSSWTYALSPAQPTQIHGSCEVSELAINADLSDVAFRIEPKPGEFYYDEALQSTYQKSEGGEADVDIKQLVRIKETHRERIVLAIASLLLVLVVTYVLLTTFRTKR